MPEAAWAECCNARLAERDHIDHRSYERQGIDQIPTVHEGYAARQRVADGLPSDRVQLNNEIRQKNTLLQRIAAQLKAIGEEIKQFISEQNKEKGSVINAGKQRIADLLARRNRAIDNDDRGTSGGERTPEGRIKKAAPSARKGKCRTERGNRNIKKSSSLPGESRARVKYRFIQENSHLYSVARMARILGVSESGYYKYISRLSAPPTEKELDDIALAEEIYSVFHGSRGSFGSRKITYLINRNRSRKINHKRIERLMQEYGLFSRVRRKYIITTDSNHDHPIADNLISRDFRA